MKLLRSLKEYLNLEKPEALTWDGWDEWHDATKAEKPIPYFIMETVPDLFSSLKRKLFSPFTDFRYYVKARFFDRYHLINTRLPYGYHDTRERVLYGMFSLLVDYVELELAHMATTDSKVRRPWWSKGIFRFKSFRCPEDGIQHLLWEASLTSHDPQAETAREVLDLYFWWTKIRPLRQDPWSISGAETFYKEHGVKSILSDKNKTPEQKKLQAEYAKRSMEIETAFVDEDNMQLERLIKIRTSLWT